MAEQGDSITVTIRSQQPDIIITLGIQSTVSQLMAEITEKHQHHPEQSKQRLFCQGKELHESEIISQSFPDKSNIPIILLKIFELPRVPNEEQNNRPQQRESHFIKKFIFVRSLQ